FKAEYYKQIAEIQKNKIKELENDLKAKEQKNNEIHQKENKNDLRAIFDTQNDKIKLDSINQKINQIKQIAEIQKNKIKELENDLKAKEQKNNEIHQKENKNDLRAIFDTQNDKIKLDSINQKINQIKQELATLTKKSQDLEFIEHLSSHNLS
ncbi:hypothetical protein, partial [Campylobacter jejuni]|uniref:hypothetical protein n=1 Tax=Campylobacter jejuni TaxID=197 RepID=UPI003D31BE8C